MKKVKSNKKVTNNNKFMLVLALSVVIMAFLIISLTKSKDSRSRANDSVEAGVVLPVASERE